MPKISIQHFLRVSVSNLIAIKLIHFWFFGWDFQEELYNFFLFLFILLAFQHNIKTLTQSNKLTKKKWQGFRNSVSQLLRVQSL